LTSKIISDYFHLKHTADVTKPDGSKLNVWDYKDTKQSVNTHKPYQIKADRNLVNIKFGAFSFHGIQPYIYYSQLSVETFNAVPYSNIVPGNREQPGWDISPFKFDYKSVGIGSKYNTGVFDRIRWNVNAQVSPFCRSEVGYITISGEWEYHNYSGFQITFGTKIY